MAYQFNPNKIAATALSISLAAATALPSTAAFAHERHNPGVHYDNGHGLSKKAHRKFHNRYGRGYAGTDNYRQQRAATRNHKRKKSNKGDLIAAGIIGLAIGAIIASEGNRQRSQPTYTYSDPYPTNQPQPYGHTYDQSYSNGYDQPRGIPLDEYDAYGSSNVSGNGGPQVITFNDPADLEPWSPGWHEWCTNRFRSFNPQRGTYRGYDGLDHFCVPK